MKQDTIFKLEKVKGKIGVEIICIKYFTVNGKKHEAINSYYVFKNLTEVPQKYKTLIINGIDKMIKIYKDVNSKLK